MTKATAVAPAVKWHNGELTWKAQKIGYFHFIDYKHKEPEDGRWRWGDGVSELLEDMRRRYPTPLCFTVSPWRPFLSECTLADFPSAAEKRAAWPVAEGHGAPPTAGRRGTLHTAHRTGATAPPSIQQTAA